MKILIKDITLPISDSINDSLREYCAFNDCAIGISPCNHSNRNILAVKDSVREWMCLSHTLGLVCKRS